MYLEQSKFRGAVRIRIMQRAMVAGVWKNRLVRHIGTARHELDIAVMMQRGRSELRELRLGAQLALSFSEHTPEMSQLRRTGDYWQLAEIALGSVYDRLGLPKLAFIRLLVVARIVFPRSKLRTAGFLSECLDTPCHENQLYRAMDVLAARQTAVLKQVRSYTIATYPKSVGYVLYDVTTLYFEKDEDDEEVTNRKTDEIQPGLRKKGYSKDHRGDLPQVVLGLAVNELGMPLSYQLHSGDTYEGHTLLSGIEATLDDLNETDLTVVADAGMLSARNLTALEERGLHYIVGARLKSMGASDQNKILSLDFGTDALHDLTISNRRVVVSYSVKRAERAKKLRDKSVARLERLLAKGTAVRKHSYLDFTVKDTPKLKQAAIEAAAQWDGIKGYVTNQAKETARADEIIAHYTSLFRVEQSFRLYKSDIAVRPAFHYKPERIQAHVIICMLALSVMRILEQEVRPLGLTLDQAIGEISSAKAAVVSLNGQEFVIPPKYTTGQIRILTQLHLPT